MGELIYIDEHQRRRWLARLEAARVAGEAIVAGIQSEDAVIIPFPVPEQ